MNKNLNRRDFLKVVGLGAASFAVPGCKSSSKEMRKRPNIVFIMADVVPVTDRAPSEFPKDRPELFRGGKVLDLVPVLDPPADPPFLSLPRQ